MSDNISEDVNPLEELLSMKKGALTKILKSYDLEELVKMWKSLDSKVEGYIQNNRLSEMKKKREILLSDMQKKSTQAEELETMIKKLEEGADTKGSLVESSASVQNGVKIYD